MTRIRQIAALFMGLTYAVSGVVGPTVHHESADVRLNSDPVIAQHTCEGEEIHLSPESVTHCLACSSLLSRTYLCGSGPPPLSDPLSVVAFYSLTADQCLESDIFHSGTRGPPIS